MRESLKLKLDELIKDDTQIQLDVAAHNARVEEYLKDETDKLRKRAQIHDAKFAEFLRELGLPDKFSVLKAIERAVND